MPARSSRSAPSPSLALTALAALAGCTAESQRAGLPHPERVLLAVVDATHAAHVSAYGDPDGLTPAIDDLAETGVRFARAFSNNTWTLASTASLFTGRLQENHGAVTNEHLLDDGATTLAERFRQAGWATAAFVQMAYASAEFGFGQGFDTFRYYGKGQAGRAGQTVPQALEWLDEHRDEPWFVYLHLRRPHSPYKPNPGILAQLDRDCPLAHGERNEELEFVDSLGWRDTLSSEEREHALHLYRANLGTTDAVLGRVLEEAKAQGALIVLTSDHGEGFGQHGYFGHGASLYAEGVDVPLVFWWPDAEPRVDEDPASTVDIAPTLLEVCGLPAPPADDLDGTSLVPRLLGESAGDESARILSARYTRDTLPAIGVVEGDWKLVLGPEGDAELFHRREDPGDSVDRSTEEPERTSRLAELARGWREHHQEAASGGVRNEGIDPAISADLEALGYGGE